MTSPTGQTWGVLVTNTMVDITNTTMMKIHQLAHRIHTPSGMEQVSIMMITNAIYPIIAGAYRAALGKAESSLTQNALLSFQSCKTARVKELPDFKENNMTVFLIIIT